MAGDVGGMAPFFSTCYYLGVGFEFGEAEDVHLYFWMGLGWPPLDGVAGWVGSGRRRGVGRYVRRGLR